MISLTCTNCKAVLEMDDGFAGGVCRCQHCGTIQTVPSKLKDRNGRTKSHSASKTLYAKVARGEAIPSSGLDQLAQVVASSGLASERIRAETVAAPVKPGSLRLVLLTCAGALLGMGITIGAWVALKGPSSEPTQALSAGAGPVVHQNSNVTAAPAPERSDGPNFCEMPIQGKLVVYVLDRGNSMRDLLSYVKVATYRSLESLGSDRKFQIIFWNNGSEQDLFHPSIPTVASSQAIGAAQVSLNDVAGHGQSDVSSAMKLAVGVNPDAIVLITAKGWQLDETFTDQVMSIRGDKPIKIHTVTLAGSEQSEVLRAIAKRSGGHSRLVTEGELKRYAAGN
jgi:hypothetical protein